jgi:hypothetical protein
VSNLFCCCLYLKELASNSVQKRKAEKKKKKKASRSIRNLRSKVAKVSSDLSAAQENGVKTQGTIDAQLLELSRLKAVAKENQDLKEDILKVMEEGCCDVSKWQKINDGTDERYSSEYIQLIMKLAAKGSSKSVIRGTISDLLQEVLPKQLKQGVDYHVPSQDYINNVRRDMMPLGEVVAAFLVASCDSILTLCQDASNIDGSETMTLGGVLKLTKDSTKGVSVTLSPSFLASNKTAAGEYEGINQWFERGRENLRFYYNQMKEDGLDISDLPDPDGCSLMKLGKGTSIVMADNASTAKNVSQLIIDEVYREHEGETDFQIILAGCFAHARDLFIKEYVKNELELLKVLFKDWNFNTFDRLEADCSSLLFAIQKNFSGGHGVYAHSHVKSFVSWLKEAHPSAYIFPPGRHGTGNRQDVQCEYAWAIFYNLQYYNEWLVQEIEKGENKNLTRLDTSVYGRATTKIFQACFRARSLMWHVCYRHLRELINGVNEGVSISDVGRILDCLYEFMKKLETNPELAREPTCRAFAFVDYPTLTEYQGKLDQRKMRSADGKHYAFAETLQKSVLFESVTDPTINALTDQFIVEAAKGAITSLERNCPDWLTHMDGKYCWGKWTDEMIQEASVGGLKTNIALGEAPFAVVDYLYRRFVNGSVFTASGVAQCRINNTFGVDVEGKPPPLRSIFNPQQIESLLRMVRKKRNYFRNQNSADVEAQRSESAKKEQEKHDQYVERQHHRQQLSISLNILQRVERSADVNPILLSMSSKTKQKVWLKHQLQIITIGFNLKKYEKNFSSKNDKNLGTVEEMANRLMLAIDDIDESVFSKPPHLVTETETAIRYMAEQTDEVKDLHAKYAIDNSNFVDDILELNKKYGVTLIQPWENLVLTQWPVILSEEQLEYPRDEEFNFSGDPATYISCGFLWRENPQTKSKEYCNYYYKKEEEKEAPTDLRDPRVISTFSGSIEYEVLALPRGRGYGGDKPAYWKRVGEEYIDEAEKVTYQIHSVCVSLADKKLLFFRLYPIGIDVDEWLRQINVNDADYDSTKDDPFEYKLCCEM